MSRPSADVSGAARAAAGDMTSAPATPAADAPIRWRRLTSMVTSSCGCALTRVRNVGVTQKCDDAGRGGRREKAIVGSRVNALPRRLWDIAKVLSWTGQFQPIFAHSSLD